MVDSGDVIVLANDYSKDVIEDVIKKEQFTNYKTVVTNGSERGENFLGIIRSVSVTGMKEDGEKGEMHLILKLPLSSIATREKFPIGNLYNREVLGYSVVLPKLVEFQSKFDIAESQKFKFIKCYSADSDKMKEYLIFEDMRAKKFKMLDKKVPMDLKHLKLALKTLANLHALSFGMRQENPAEFAELTEGLENPLVINKDFEYYLHLQKDRAVRVLDDPKCVDRLNAFGVDLYDKMMSYVSSKIAEPYNVISHGDCWNNNILFKYQGSEVVDIVFLDWQMLRFTSPITDIGYLIFTSTDQEVRRDFDDIMNYYYYSLKMRLSILGMRIEDVYPENIYREHAKKLLPFGLLSALILIPSVVCEKEDVRDIEFLSEKEKIDISDLDFENEESAKRYKYRISGIVEDFVRLNLI